MVKKFLFIAMLLTTVANSAQIHEAGIFVGGSNYIGDIGPTNYILPSNFAGGIIYKYNFSTISIFCTIYS